MRTKNGIVQPEQFSETFIILKLLLNHYEKEGVITMKKMWLSAVFATGIISHLPAATTQKQYSLKLLVGTGEC